MDALQSLTRRQCLKLMGAAGLACSAPGLVLRPAEAAGLSGQSQVSRTLPMMNTLVTITIHDSSRQRADQAMESAFEAMRELVRVFDRFDPASHLSHLNATGVLRDVPPALARVLRTAQHVHVSSNRVFDVTILPLLELTEHSLQTTGHPPEHKAVQELLGAIGQDRVHIGDRIIRFDRADTRITLDGIAKGYIVDQAAEVLKRHSIDAAVINAGGDIRVLGSKQGRPWRIGIQDPSGRHTPVQTLALRDMAVATSGSYENFFDPLMRHHHLLESSGNGSPRRVVSATAVAPSAMMADSLSTTFFLLPPEQAVSLASSLKSVEASIITFGGRHFTSDNWSSIGA